MNGMIGFWGEVCIEFVDNVKEKFNIEMMMWDECLLMMVVEWVLLFVDVSCKKCKKVIDKMVVVMIF